MLSRQISVNDAIIKILDDLNDASNGVWNLKLTSSNQVKYCLKIVDVNLIPERDNDSEDLILISLVNHLVSDAQIKYSTPE